MGAAPAAAAIGSRLILSVDLDLRLPFFPPRPPPGSCGRGLHEHEC